MADGELDSGDRFLVGQCGGRRGGRFQFQVGEPIEHENQASDSVRLRIAYPSESADEPFERAFGGKMGKRWVKVAGEQDLGGRGNNLILNDECHS